MLFYSTRIIRGQDLTCEPDHARNMAPSKKKKSWVCRLLPVGQYLGTLEQEYHREIEASLGCRGRVCLQGRKGKEKEEETGGEDSKKLSKTTIEISMRK